MKAIVVDDESSNIENLAILLEKYCPHVNLLASATNINSALDLIGMYKPDILFLDIQIGEHTGFDLLKSNPVKNFEVIFITAFDKYGIDAIKFSALDYLLKPITIPDLIIAVNKAEKKLAEKQKNSQLEFLLNHIKNKQITPTKIALPQLQEIRYVSVDEIIRCEADNSYTLFYLVNGDRIVVSRSIKEYVNLLKPIRFLRTHQSHLFDSLGLTYSLTHVRVFLLCAIFTNAIISSDKPRPVENPLTKSGRARWRLMIGVRLVSSKPVISKYIADLGKSFHFMLL